jgi:hypothetical protein
MIGSLPCSSILGFGNLELFLLSVSTWLLTSSSGAVSGIELWTSVD